MNAVYFRHLSLLDEQSLLLAWGPPAPSSQEFILKLVLHSKRNFNPFSVLVSSRAHFWHEGRDFDQFINQVFLCAVFDLMGSLSHLQERGCPLHGIHGTPDLAAHEHRFLQNGWTTACARDMNAVYNKHIDPSDRRRCVINQALSSKLSQPPWIFCGYLGLLQRNCVSSTQVRLFDMERELDDIRKTVFGLVEQSYEVRAFQRICGIDQTCSRQLSTLARIWLYRA